MEVGSDPISNTNLNRWRMYNVILLGIAFMLMFTAFQTSSMIEQTVLEGAKNQTNGTFKGSGYTSLAVIYAVFAASNWIAPSVVAVCGAKISMIIGGICYTLFIASFLKPMTWSLYVGSVIVGVGAAVIWTGQGNFLTINSDAETIGRNSGIFWAILQFSLLIGNLFVYFAFKKSSEEISAHTRFGVYIVLASICCAGVLMLFLLRPKKARQSASELNLNASNESRSSAWNALVQSFKLLTTKQMVMLMFAFAYTGLELTFFSGVYGTCVGHTLLLPHEKSLQGLTGMFIGVGEIIGGALFGLLGKTTNKFGRDPVVLLGFFVHTVCYYLIFINLPDVSPLQASYDRPFLFPNKYVVMLCAFLLGLGDSSYNTQIYSVLGFLHPDNSAPAFALYKFIQSLTAAAGFFYSEVLYLKWQLLILVIFNCLGATTFFMVEREARKPVTEGYTKVEEEEE